jgi:hypothetical protein
MIFRQGEWEAFGSGHVLNARTYKSANGSKSKYPTITMAPGDRMFVPNAKAMSGDPFYASLLNRKTHDPTFDYIAFTRKFYGEFGLMIRCVERRVWRAKNKV